MSETPKPGEPSSGDEILRMFRSAGRTVLELPATYKKIMGIGAIIAASSLATVQCKSNGASREPLPSDGSPLISDAGFVRDSSVPSDVQNLPAAFDGGIPDVPGESGPDVQSDTELGDPENDDVEIDIPGSTELTFEPLGAITAAKRKLHSRPCALRKDGKLVIAARQNDKPDIQCVRITKYGETTLGFHVEQVGKANGINTKYRITVPSGYVLLALKRNIPVRSERNQKKIVSKEVVYTPFTPDLNVQAVRNAGVQYLLDLINEANTTLGNKRITSRALRGQRIEEAIPPNVSLTLSIIEHMDDNRLMAGTSDYKQLFEEALMIIGANKDDAYDYAVSHIRRKNGTVAEGARGLFQFIRKTYAAIVTSNPRAGIDPNFVTGMNNHRNAALAAQLLNDENLTHIQREYLQVHAQDPLELGKLLAAAYNGGPKQLNDAIAAGGEQWPKYLATKETRLYVQKFEKVWKDLLPQYLSR